MSEAIPFGVSFDGFVPVREAVEVARRAEAAGARSFWIAEHLGYREAFVTATAALEAFWSDDTLANAVCRKADRIRAGLEHVTEEYPGLFLEVRGRGLIQGLVTRDPKAATAIAMAAFERGLVIETAGPADEVVKLLPPLVVDEDAGEVDAHVMTPSAARPASDRSGSGAARAPANGTCSDPRAGPGRGRRSRGRRDAAR